MARYSTDFVKPGQPITAAWANRIAGNFASLNSNRRPNWATYYDSAPVFTIKKMEPVLYGEEKVWELTIINCVPSVETRYGYVYYLEPLIYHTYGVNSGKLEKAEVNSDNKWTGLEKRIKIPVAEDSTGFHITLQIYWKKDGDVEFLEEAGFEEVNSENIECCFFRVYNDSEWQEERLKYNNDRRTVLKIAQINVESVNDIAVENWLTSSPHYKYRPYQAFEPYGWEYSGGNFTCRIWPGYVIEKIPQLDTDGIITHEVEYDEKPLSNLDDPPVFSLSDGDYVYLKIVTSDRGEITDPPTITISQSEEESIHYIPPKPDESSGTDGEFYIKLFQYNKINPPSSYYGGTVDIPDVTQYYNDSVEWEPYVWKGDHIGPKSGKIYKGYKGEDMVHEFRSIEPDLGETSLYHSVSSVQLQVNTGDESVNITGNGVNRTIVFRLLDGLYGGDGVYGSIVGWLRFTDGLLAAASSAPDDIEFAGDAFKTNIYFPVP